MSKLIKFKSLLCFLHLLGSNYHSIAVFCKINLIEVESFCRNALHYASYIPKNLEQKAGQHLPKATNIVFQEK